MQFSSAFLDEIRARVPVSDVVRQKVKLQRPGREWRGLSPFTRKRRRPSSSMTRRAGYDFSSGRMAMVSIFSWRPRGFAFRRPSSGSPRSPAFPCQVETEAAEQDQKRAWLGEVLEWAARFFEEALRRRAGRSGRDYLAQPRRSGKREVAFGSAMLRPSAIRPARPSRRQGRVVEAHGRDRALDRWRRYCRSL